MIWPQLDLDSTIHTVFVLKNINLFSLTDEEKLNKISSLEKKIKTFVVENIQLKKKNEQMKNAILKQREIMLGNGFFKKILFIFKNSGGHPILSFGVPYFSDIWDL